MCWAAQYGSIKAEAFVFGACSRHLRLGFYSKAQTRSKLGFRSVKAQNSSPRSIMIYDVNSSLFRSFLSQKGGSSDRKMEQKPKEQRPKASENKPVGVKASDEREVKTEQFRGRLIRLPKVVATKLALHRLSSDGGRKLFLRD
ncbi:Wound-induced basic protein, partial [Cucurbita argyrosperma subsp. argyrosperma]